MKAKIQALKTELGIQDKHLFIAGGVIGAGIVAFAAYKFLFSKKTKQTPITPVQQEKSFQQIYRQVIKSVQQAISKHKSLNSQVIKCILKNQYKLAQQEYKTYILKVRNQRRKLIKDKHEYRRVILTIDSAIQQLMDKHLNAILAHFNIDKTIWIQTVDFWSTQSQQNKEEWENLLVQLDNEQLDSLRNSSKNPLPYKNLQDIVKFKIHTLKHLNQSGLDLDSSINTDDEQDLNGKYTLIDKYIQDLVVSKYGVQEEDINFSETKLSEEDKDKFATISDQFTELIRVEIFGDQSIQQEGRVYSQQGDQEQQGNQQGDAQEEDGAQYY